MSGLAPTIERALEALGRLPGVGRKTAQRLAFHLLGAPKGELAELVEALRELGVRIRPCRVCFNLAEEELCPVCQDPRRETATLCVVERASDLLPLERTGYRGLYHVLGGCLSPLGEVGPDDLNVAPLLERVESGTVQEVILANNPTVEGEATAHYLAGLLRPLGVRVTRIAQGLPVGSDLEYTDEVTLTRALAGRREIS
jgi:recombination protein RecR